MSCTGREELEPLGVLPDMAKQDLFPSKQVISGESLSCWLKFVWLDDSSSCHDTCQAIASLLKGSCVRFVWAELRSSNTEEAFEVAPAAEPESPGTWESSPNTAATTLESSCLMVKARDSGLILEMRWCTSVPLSSLSAM